jgi:hypothetical protein
VGCELTYNALLCAPLVEAAQRRSLAMLYAAVVHAGEFGGHSRVTRGKVCAEIVTLHAI